MELNFIVSRSDLGRNAPVLPDEILDEELAGEVRGSSEVAPDEDNPNEGQQERKVKKMFIPHPSISYSGLGAWS